MIILSKCVFFPRPQSPSGRDSIRRSSLGFCSLPTPSTPQDTKGIWMGRWGLLPPVGTRGHLLDDPSKRPQGPFREKSPTVSSCDRLSWNFWKPLGSIRDVGFNFQGRLGILIQGKLSEQSTQEPDWHTSSGKKKTASLFILTGKTSNFSLTRQKWDEAGKASRWDKERERQVDGWKHTWIEWDQERETHIYIWTCVEPQATEEEGRTGNTLKQSFYSSPQKHNGILDSNLHIIP